MLQRPFVLSLCFGLVFTATALKSSAEKPTADSIVSNDWVATLQQQSVETNVPLFGHWGPNAKKYSSWKTHTNRLIPIYTFGGDLAQVNGRSSVYRDADKLKELYGFEPTQTLNAKAEYFDQTDVYRLQELAAASGKKRIILMVFDGMDWQTTRAASIVKAGAVKYDSGRGGGLWFQDYRGTQTDFGSFVTSPHNEGTTVNVDDQRVTKVGGKILGGFDPARCGSEPWSEFSDSQYPIAASQDLVHAYTDSASAATSMTCGIKTYNDAINVDASGREVLPIARKLQEQGFAVGVVTSVPISHATPACAYANNVHRDDYQDLTRDMLGLPSVFHPGGLPGVDVLIGAGWEENKNKDGPQGKNFVPGNRYLTLDDLDKVNAASGGKYHVVQRASGIDGATQLRAASSEAVSERQRLLGFYGVKGGHLPFRTANGDFRPVDSFGTAANDKAEKYTPADVSENPQLADMALAAVEVLQSRSDRWWLMIEAGDVDWANHSNNIDNSIGAVFSGDDTFKAITQWIENHGGWSDTLVLVTADHGHYLVLDKPEQLVGK